ncbi:Fc.00g073250.m01.CDS01 [Cosmosporella sp. VM-42]
MTSSLDTVTPRSNTIKIGDESDIVEVNDMATLAQLVDTLDEPPKTMQPSIYIDLEGVNLSRHGTVSIMQIYHLPLERTYLIDVFTLGDKCFSTPGSKGRTLKQILESEDILKVFFDVRNDSDALYGNYQIKLAGIQDLQLMELATRTFSKRCVNGLSKCIERDALLSSYERSVWAQIKDNGVRLFAPEKGGRYEVFNERPMLDGIKSYCAQDVQILPRLWEYYDGKISQEWRKIVMTESKARVQLSQSSTYQGKGKHMALAPVGWL